MPSATVHPFPGRPVPIPPTQSTTPVSRPRHVNEGSSYSRSSMPGKTRPPVNLTVDTTTESLSPDVSLIEQEHSLDNSARSDLSARREAPSGDRTPSDIRRAPLRPVSPFVAALCSPDSRPTQLARAAHTAACPRPPLSADAAVTVAEAAFDAEEEYIEYETGLRVLRKEVEADTKIRVAFLGSAFVLFNALIATSRTPMPEDGLIGEYLIAVFMLLISSIACIFLKLVDRHSRWSYIDFQLERLRLISRLKSYPGQRDEMADTIADIETRTTSHNCVLTYAWVVLWLYAMAAQPVALALLFSQVICQLPTFESVSYCSVKTVVPTVFLYITVGALYFYSMCQSWRRRMTGRLDKDIAALGIGSAPRQTPVGTYTSVNEQTGFSTYRREED